VRGHTKKKQKMVMELKKRKQADRLPRFCGSLELKNGLHPFCRALRCCRWKAKISLQLQCSSLSTLSFPFSLLSRFWRTTTPCLSLFWQRARESIKYGNGSLFVMALVLLIRNYYVDLCSQAENKKVQTRTGHPPITVT